MKSIKKFKSYLVKFKEDDTMKTKSYLSDYKVKDDKRQPIIIIIHDKHTFLSNNNICKAWSWINNTFLQPKKHR